MPDKPLTVFTYAATASLAAVALVYFFHPSYLIDGEASSSSASSRKKGIVGLYNPANDCFINCVLQSLAGLGDLRVYLIREMHRRELEGSDVYAVVPEKDAMGKEINARKLLSLQSGEVTKGLKDMIDKLNEKPLYRKTISATSFIRVLEHAFGTTISKTQQDAQELLQLIAERLREEYHAGCEARKRFKNGNLTDGAAQGTEEQDKPFEEETASRNATDPSNVRLGANAVLKSVAQGEIEEGFPLEGQTEARVECKFCAFVPKATPTNFVMLNLMVPQTSSSTLNDCFDAHFKTEFIDDYKCDKCRLAHALEQYKNRLAKTKSKAEQGELEQSIKKIKDALREDPEKPPEGVALPDSHLAPKRKIARHMEIKFFPKVLVIHLSRSIFDPTSTSMKNLAKVTFPEKLPVGGILNRRNYKLLGVVSHKGTHNSGHYETFRRQHSYGPYSNPNADSDLGPFSRNASPNPSQNPSPNIQPAESNIGETDRPVLTDEAADESGTCSSARTSGTHSLPSTAPSTVTEEMGESPDKAQVESSTPAASNTETSKPPTPNSFLSPPSTADNRSKSSSLAELTRLKRRKKPADRWWRISDDKIKECKLSEVLGMTKEVYMLFYEMERSDIRNG